MFSGRVPNNGELKTNPFRNTQKKKGIHDHVIHWDRKQNYTLWRCFLGKTAWRSFNTLQVGFEFRDFHSPRPVTSQGWERERNGGEFIPFPYVLMSLYLTRNVRDTLGIRTQLSVSPFRAANRASIVLCFALFCVCVFYLFILF